MPILVKTDKISKTINPFLYEPLHLKHNKNKYDKKLNMNRIEGIKQ